MPLRRARLLLLAILPLLGCTPGGSLPGLPALEEPGLPATARHGRLTRPAGAGPFPAVILLHGCGGPRANAPAWTAALRAAGFLVLEVDQFRRHGLAQICDSGPALRTLLAERARDTVELVRALQRRPDILPGQVSVVGFSHGGSVAGQLASDLPAWDAEPGGDEERPPLAAAVAVYPECLWLSRSLARPLLILAGREDDWALPARCEDFAAALADHAPRPRLAILPGARHGFDLPGPARLELPGVSNGNRPGGRGATVGYAPEAAEAARRQAIAFLRGR